MSVKKKRLRAKGTPGGRNGITYEIDYGPSGWQSRMDGASARVVVARIGKILRRGFPKTKFCDAMDACCERFCSHMPRDLRPWHEHFKLGGAARQSLLMEKATKGWQLDWYWKVLLTSLPEWRDRLRPLGIDRIYIRLSQIRSWVMVTVFFRPPRRTRQSERLLKPPVFGRSGRLAEWDQYWLYLLNGREVVAEWDEVRGKGHGAIDRAYVVGRHDVTYEVAWSNVKVRPRSRTMRITISGGLDLAPYVADSRRTLHGRRLARRQIEAERWDPADLVRIPQHHIKWKGARATRHVDLLLASDRVCEALALLSDVWSDPTIRKLHLNAPPGSGKDVLSDTLAHCRRRRGKSLTVSLSPRDASANALSLLGRPVSAGRRAGAGAHEPGLVKQAERGILVVDEIDKVSDDTRSTLLRVLETNRFLVPGTNVEEKLDEDAPFFFFLSSKPIEEVNATCGPPDFWTRIPFTIEMKHPFDIDDSLERRRALEQYLWMFWNSHTEKFGRLARDWLALQGSSGVRKAGSRRLVARKACPVTGYFTNTLRFLKCKAFVQRACAALAEELEARYGTISVRNLRSIVQRCAFKFVQWLFYSRPHELVATVAQDEASRELRKKIEGFIGSGRFAEAMGESDIVQAVEAVAKGSLERRVDYPE